MPRSKQLRFTWQDEYSAELAAMDLEDLFCRKRAFDCLNSNTASERFLDCALMVDAEIARREEKARQTLGIPNVPAV